MSDFFSIGWSVYVAAATVAGLAACLVLLFIASRRKVMADDNTTGHIWEEDLRELNNPLPRWWMGLFVLTIVFSFGYLALYPGLGSFAGTLGFKPEAFLMAVAIGAGCDFLTPIGHQCNTLVMGPGGYRFGDYWHLGLPLSVLVVLLGVPMIALVWPI